jgi:hypothetical protein
VIPGHRPPIVLLGAIALGLQVVVATAAFAQETVNYASISGRVWDPQGAAVPGAQVTARQTETDVISETTSDREGRFRFPYLRIGPYEINVRLQGFADAVRRVSLTVGSAFDMPISLSVGALDENLTVVGQSTVIEAVRSQIAGVAVRGAKRAAQRPELPRSRAARAWSVADQRWQHPAVCGDVGGARTGALGGEPAQFLQ